MLACDEDGQGRRRTVKELCEFPAAPGIFKNFLPIGKERAEFWVYFAVVVAWIAFALYGARLMIWPN
jgi:hypothetical protein